MGRLTERRKQR
jgi:recomb_XerD: tyrosine recombinase XerD